MSTFLENPALRLVTLAERPDLENQIHRLNTHAWPDFIQNNESGRFWGELFVHFTEHQLLLCDEGDNVLGVGHTLPIEWDGTAAGLPDGWDAAIERGVRGREIGAPVNHLCALAVVVSPQHRGHGLSPALLRGMRAVAETHGWGSVIVPVRPTLKSQYPLVPMERYARWTRPDGAPFDPWIRTHAKLGARMLRVATHSMLVRGTVADWERWTKMRFPESGEYVVPGALQLVRIDCERDEGVYHDQNVWMEHRVTGGE